MNSKCIKVCLLFIEEICVKYSVCFMTANVFITFQTYLIQLSVCVTILNVSLKIINNVMSGKFFFVWCIDWSTCCSSFHFCWFGLLCFSFKIVSLDTFWNIEQGISKLPIRSIYSNVQVSVALLLCSSLHQLIQLDLD